MAKVIVHGMKEDGTVDADEIHRGGGSGYCISLDENGQEHYDKSKDEDLPYEIEHIMPDYFLRNFIFLTLVSTKV